MHVFSLIGWLALAAAVPDGQVPAGAAAGEFELTQGEVRWRSADYPGPIVVAFLGVGCPLSRPFSPQLSELARAYAGRVEFVAVNANFHDRQADLPAAAKAAGLSIPYFADADAALANRLGATRNPQVVLLDGKRQIRYRGRISDQYTRGGERAAATRQDLREALDELLAGREITVAETEAVGCVIDRPREPSADSRHTYHRDVAPILTRACTACHMPGGMAPFALTSYEVARGWSETIAEVVREGIMPPWHADPKIGKFANDPSLSAVEKQTLLDWAASGAAEGLSHAAPPIMGSAASAGIGEPDLVFSAPEHLLPATGILEYQQFDVDPGFKEDVWIQAVELVPGNRQVVHHATVYYAWPGAEHPSSPEGELPGFCLALYVPGQLPTIYPPGIAKRIPAGMVFRFVIHYVTIGRATQDQTRLALRLAPAGTVRQEVASSILMDADFTIPPGAKDYRLEEEVQFQDDVQILSLFPHMHLRGKSFRYEARFPDGRVETLLSVPRYNVHWQSRYEFAEPVRLPAGTRLAAIGNYDNSADNPANPDPTVAVRVGRQTTDEMFNGYYDVVLADQNLLIPPTLLQHARKWLARPETWLIVCGGLSLAWFLVRRRRLARGGLAAR